MTSYKFAFEIISAIYYDNYKILSFIINGIVAKYQSSG